MSPIFRLSLAALAALLFAAPSFAQKKPKENAQVLVAIETEAINAPTTELVYFKLLDASGGPNPIDTNFFGAGTSATKEMRYAPLMTPGHHYQIIFSCGAWDYGEIKLSAPAGYVFFIGDMPASTIRTADYSGGLGTYLEYKIELRALDGSMVLPAGDARPPQMGDVIWQISTGRHPNGVPVGPIQWRTDSYSADLLDATSLQFPEPDAPEFQVLYHSDGGLLDVWSPQFRAHVVRNSGTHAGYTIEIRTPAATVTSGSGDGPYTFDEDPYRKYIVTNPDGSTWAGRIQIVKQDLESGVVVRTETWTIGYASSVWTLTQASGARLVVLTSSINGTTGDREEIVEVKDGSTVATKIKRIYDTMGWGQEELLSEIAAPDTAALTTTYEYYTNSSLSSYGRLKSVSHPDGSWVLYEYDDTTAGWGNLKAIYRPWQDSPTAASSATSTNCHVTLFSYAPDNYLPANAARMFNELPAGTETKILGYTTAKNTISYSSIYGGYAPIYGNRLQDQTIVSYSASGTSTTTTRVHFHNRYADEQHRGRLAAQTAPDGTKVSTLRYQGYFWNYGDNNATDLHKWPGNPSADTLWGEYHFNGFSSAVTSAVQVHTWDGQSIDPVYMVPNRSTVTLTVFNSEGRPWFNVNYVFTGASSGVPTLEFIGMEQISYFQGQLFSVERSNGFLQLNLFIGPNQVWDCSNEGVNVWLDRDVMGQVRNTQKTSVSSSGSYPAQAQIYTHYTRDVAGRVTQTRVSDSATASDPGITTSATYDLAGRVLTTTDPDGLVTSYSYSPSTRTTTVTLPGGFTKITTLWRDGSLKSVTGTAVTHSYQDMSVNTSNGQITTTTYALRASDLSTPTSAPRWSKTTTDWLGRTIKQERPAYSSGTFTKQFYFDSYGRPNKTTETGLADSLIEYNAWNQPYRAGLDINANGALNLSSDDRISETDSIFEKDGSNAWWSKTTATGYNQSGSSTPFTKGITKSRLNKFTSTLQAETVTTDIFGNVTTQTVNVDRTAKLVTSTANVPDSSTDVVSISRNGLPQTAQSAQGLISWTYYDSLGRMTKQTHPRTDTSTTARIAYSSNSTRIASQQDTAGNTTSFSYNSTTGRLASMTDPLGKISYLSYNDRGQTTRSWGQTSYPVEYGYNDYGEQTTMSTFRAGTGWTASTWPASPGTADTTTWAYETATGLLLSKTDAASNAVAYTYNARGQLATRTWDRGVSTTYSYSSTTAEQTGINYSDSTPDLTYTYNRLGQLATVADDTGTRTFAYSTTNTTLTSETLPSYYGSRVLTRNYDTTTTGALGRNVGFVLSGASGSGTDYSVAYGYDSSGRFNSVAAGGLTHTYGFTSNSNLIATISETSGWMETMSYESNRDLLASISGVYSATTKAAFAYTHDVLGRRTSVANSGEIFSSYVGSGISTVYGYNDRSEVTSAQSYHGTNPADTSSPVAGRGFGYAFDNIGSRTSSSVVGANLSDIHTTTYSNNNLNQVTSRTAPASTDVSGLAPTAATITINSSTAGITRQGEFYYKNVTAGSTPLWQSISVSSSLGGSSTRYSYISPAPESITYDDDGNVTDDGRWIYTWDAENRLTKLETSTAARGVGVPWQKVWFYYDYLGRRTRKILENWSGSAWVAALDRKFIYNGWNLIAEHDVLASNAAIVRYTWGLDLSGNLQDGGGVGGLLAIFDLGTSTTHLPAYDANGNLHALVNRATGALTAVYEYSPFGETLRATGAYAAANNFRFSTKYTDAETGLLYYGYRYYQPSLGRWLGRDPIGEAGGLNLYGFCGNSGVNTWDYLGTDYTIVSTNGNSSLINGDPDPSWTKYAVNEWFYGWVAPDGHRYAYWTPPMVGYGDYDSPGEDFSAFQGTGSAFGSFADSYTTGFGYSAQLNSEVDGMVAFGQSVHGVIDTNNALRDSGSSIRLTIDIDGNIGRTNVTTASASSSGSATTVAPNNTDKFVVKVGTPYVVPDDTPVEVSTPSPRGPQDFMGNDAQYYRDRGAINEKYAKLGQIRAREELRERLVSHPILWHLSSIGEVIEIGANYLPLPTGVGSHGAQVAKSVSQTSLPRLSPTARLIIINTLEALDDGTIVGRLPNPRTANPPLVRSAIVRVVDDNPVPGAGPLPP